VAPFKWCIATSGSARDSTARAPLAERSVAMRELMVTHLQRKRDVVLAKATLIKSPGPEIAALEPEYQLEGRR
jgi:hypothetical protein